MKEGIILCYRLYNSLFILNPSRELDVRNSTLDSRQRCLSHTEPKRVFETELKQDAYLIGTRMPKRDMQWSLTEAFSISHGFLTSHKLEKQIDLFAGEELEQACKPRNANLVQFHVSVRCLVQVSLENGGCLRGTRAEREE